MRSRLLLLLAGTALALAGCPAPTPPRASDPPRPRPATPRPSATPSAKPTPAAGATTAPIPTITPTAVPVNVLVPSAGSQALRGRITVDARYAVRAGAREVGTALAFGSGMISDHGGGMISDHGGGLIANNGGSAIAARAGGIVALDGSWLISDGGGSLIGNNAGSFRLAQAPTAPAYGETRAGAGMWVSVVDPLTGRTVPLGVDAAGQPVHVAYSDDAGAFEVHLDPAIARRGRVVVRPPAGGDDRLLRELLLPTVAAGEQALDADATLLTGLLRAVMAGRIEMLLRAAARPGMPPSATIEAGRELGTQGWTDRRLREVSALLADELLAKADETIFGELGAFRDLHHAITERGIALAGGQADPQAYFAALPWMAEINRGKAPADQFRVETPEDLPRILNQAYLVERADGFEEVIPVLQGLGVDDTIRVAAADAFNRIALLMAAAAAGDQSATAARLRELATLTETL